MTRELKDMKLKSRAEHSKAALIDGPPERLLSAEEVKPRAADERS